jgi:hypothetical protein
LAETLYAFYHWRLGAGNGTGQTRHEIINAVVVPIFEDPAIRAEAECVYARKYARDPAALPREFLLTGDDEVRLFIASLPERREAVTALVANHLGPRFPGVEPLDYPAKERAGFADCAWYRRSLTEVTAVALDLHQSSSFQDHRAFVHQVDGTGIRGFTSARLHGYLGEHSRSYEALGRAGWRIFWRDFHRWGPAPNLYPPGHLFENLLLVD